ncbi:hypothetical protein JZ751_005761, partial [Albula glossodonta]
MADRGKFLSRPLYRRDMHWDPFREESLPSRPLYESDAGLPPFLEPGDLSWIEWARRRLATSSWPGYMPPPIFTPAPMQTPLIPRYPRAEQAGGVSEIRTGPDSWRINLDVSCFSPREVEKSPLAQGRAGEEQRKEEVKDEEPILPTGSQKSEGLRVGAASAAPPTGGQEKIESLQVYAGSTAPPTGGEEKSEGLQMASATAAPPVGGQEKSARRWLGTSTFSGGYERSEAFSGGYERREGMRTSAYEKKEGVRSPTSPPTGGYENSKGLREMHTTSAERAWATIGGAAEVEAEPKEDQPVEREDKEEGEIREAEPEPEPASITELETAPQAEMDGGEVAVGQEGEEDPSKTTTAVEEVTPEVVEPAPEAQGSPAQDGVRVEEEKKHVETKWMHRDTKWMLRSTKWPSQ